MDGLSSVARPTWKPHRRWHGYSPPASFSALGPPPEAWNTRGQVRSPRPQAALEGGWPLSWPPVSLLLLLCPALIPSLPGPAGPHACKASRWMPAEALARQMKGRKSPVFPPTAHGKAIMNRAAAMGPKDILSARASLRSVVRVSRCPKALDASPGSSILGQHSPIFVNNLLTEVSSVNPSRAV